MTEVTNRSELLERYRVERLRRLRLDGSDHYVEVAGEFAAYGGDPFATPMQREPRVDDVDGGFFGYQGRDGGKPLGPDLISMLRMRSGDGSAFRGLTLSGQR